MSSAPCRTHNQKAALLACKCHTRPAAAAMPCGTACAADGAESAAERVEHAQVQAALGAGARVGEGLRWSVRGALNTVTSLPSGAASSVQDVSWLPLLCI
jgi:hypothetical protein